MNGTLTLKNPVMINGDKITEMKYDTNEIDGVLFATAEAKRKAAAGMKNLSVSAAAEFDFGLHLYLGYAAIVAVNPTYDFSDLERMKGADVVEVMALGRNFMLKSEPEPRRARLEFLVVGDPEPEIFEILGVADAVGPRFGSGILVVNDRPVDFFGQRNVGVYCDRVDRFYG